MKTFLTIATILIAATFIPAAEKENEWLGKTIPKLLLADGTTYTAITFIQIDPDAITIQHDGGVSRIDMKELRPESQQALHYDPAAAKAQQALHYDPAKAVAGLATGGIYRPLGEFFLLSAPGDRGQRIVNQKATAALGETHFLSVGANCRVKVIKIDGEWALIQAVQPDYLAATHKGWIYGHALERGTASTLKSGWIRHDVLVYSTAALSGEPVARLTQRAAVTVGDSGGTSVEVEMGTAPLKLAGSDEFIPEEADRPAKGYIAKEMFTDVLPGLW